MYLPYEVLYGRERGMLRGFLRKVSLIEFGHPFMFFLAKNSEFGLSMMVDLPILSKFPVLKNSPKTMTRVLSFYLTQSQSLRC